MALAAVVASLSSCCYIVIFLVYRFIVFLLAAGNWCPSSFDILHYCNAHLITSLMFLSTFFTTESSSSSNTIESACSCNHFTHVSLAIDDEVAKGATVGKIGSFKDIKGHEKRSSLVVKSKRKPKNTDLKRKVDKKVVSAEGASQVFQSRRTKFELVEPFEEPERELRRRLRERRNMYAVAADLSNPNTSKLPGPAGVLKSTQRSHTMVLRPRK